MPPSRGTPANIRMHLVLPETSHWPTFLSLIVRVYLHSNLCSGLQKTHFFLQQSAFCQFKVDYFGTNWKRISDFLLVGHLWLWSYLAPLLRYGDLLAKNCVFFLPISHSAPSLPMFPLEFRGKVNHQETRVMGLMAICREDHMVVAGVILTQCQRVTARQTDGLTDLL